MKKLLVIGMIIILVGMSVPSTGISHIKQSITTNLNDGSLSGFVYDVNLKPIQGARVRVYFHDTYVEGYTLIDGMYFINNIPICNCTKNCTASKPRYTCEWVMLSIDENSSYDFILTPIEDIPCNPGINGTLGEKDWFVSDVGICFNCNCSGIYYKINNLEWEGYNFEPFNIIDDGEYRFSWFYFDNDGNQSDVFCTEFKIDKTKPEMEEIQWEAYKEDGQWYVVLTCDAEDTTSGMNRAEFYVNDELMETVIGPGPTYEWTVEVLTKCSVFGLICNPRINEENVSFFALIVRINYEYSLLPSADHFRTYVYDNAGNWDYDDVSGCSPPYPYYDYFKQLTFKNEYKGYVGRFFLLATFMGSTLD